MNVIVFNQLCEAGVIVPSSVADVDKGVPRGL